jgi:hypothetical protein
MNNMVEHPGLINLSHEDLSLPIYRIFSSDYFWDLVQRAENTLVRPCKWDDPFENALLRAKCILEDGRLASINFKDDLYGQCWTTDRDSDAMWRIYSYDKTGVRVRTTVGALYRSLVESCPSYHEISCFIGKVEYQSADRIVALFSDSEWATSRVFDKSGLGQASTLLFKRPEFAHENEIRLIFYANEHNRQNSDRRLPRQAHSLK